MAKKKFKDTKVGKAAKRLGERVEKVAKSAAAAAKGLPFAPLIPFRGKMEKALKAAGINPPKPMSELALSFHKNVLRKNNFDNEYLEHSYECPENLVDDIVSVVKDIVDFIKGSKKKKGEGTATNLEKEFADEAEKNDETAGENKSLLEKITGSKNLFSIGHDVNLGGSSDSKGGILNTIKKPFVWVPISLVGAYLIYKRVGS